MHEPTLDNFLTLETQRNFPSSAWVTHEGFNALYIRVSTRYIEDEYKECIDLANIEVTHPGNKTFTTLVKHLLENYPNRTIYVESVLVRRFEEGLLRMGFKEHPHYHRSYYLPNK